MIVVTGSEGFIGNHLCAKLRACGQEIYPIDLKLGRDVACCALPECDRVFHLAAQTDAYCLDPCSDATTNILGSLRIFERYGDRVVFASSAMVNYPVNAYGISKKAGEDYARLFGCAIVRLPNVYGVGGHSFMDKCASQKHVTIYGDGTQLRTWATVDAAVNSLVLARPGNLIVVDGENKTIAEIANGFGCSVMFAPPRYGDIQNATQVMN